MMYKCKQCGKIFQTERDNEIVSVDGRLFHEKCEAPLERIIPENTKRSVSSGNSGTVIDDKSNTDNSVAYDSNKNNVTNSNNATNSNNITSNNNNTTNSHNVTNTTSIEKVVVHQQGAGEQIIETKHGRLPITSCRFCSNCKAHVSKDYYDDDSHYCYDCYDEVRIKEGIELYNEHKYDEAINSLQQAGKTTSRKEEAFHWIGKCKMNLKDYEEAMTYFAKSKSIPWSLCYLGLLHQNNNDFKSAEQNYSRAVTVGDDIVKNWAEEHLENLRNVLNQIAQKKAEQERIAKQKAEQERIAKEKKEQERQRREINERRIMVQQKYHKEEWRKNIEDSSIVLMLLLMAFLGIVVIYSCIDIFHLPSLTGEIDVNMFNKKMEYALGKTVNYANWSSFTMMNVGAVFYMIWLGMTLFFPLVILCIIIVVLEMAIEYLAKGVIEKIAVWGSNILKKTFIYNMSKNLSISIEFISGYTIGKWILWVASLLLILATEILLFSFTGFIDYALSLWIIYVLVPSTEFLFIGYGFYVYKNNGEYSERIKEISGVEIPKTFSQALMMYTKSMIGYLAILLCMTSIGYISTLLFHN